MVIGYDASRAFLKEKTGTENYSYQLLKALAKIDTENHYLVYVRPGYGESKWPKNFQFKVINFPRLWTQIGLAKQTFHDKLDVLFIPAHTSPLIHKPGLKTVVVVHDLGAEYLPKMHQLKQRLYLKWITSYQLKNATRLIAVSEATKNDLIKKVKIVSNNIKVVHEGYDSSLFISIKDDTLVNSLKEFDIKKGEFFLFVGTIQPRKNLERLIRGFKRFLEVRSGKLVIVGQKGWLSDEVYKLPKKLRIERQVKFLGRVEDKDLPVLYSGAIALIFPSLFEGFGLPILEAQACGCPVITSNISSMPEVAGKGALLIDPYSVEAIEEALARVKESQSQRIKVVKAGFENIKRFSWEKTARETLKVFEEIVG